MTKLILVLWNFRTFFNRFDSKPAKHKLKFIIANFVIKLVQVGNLFEVYDARKLRNIRKSQHWVGVLVSIIPSKNKFLGNSCKGLCKCVYKFFQVLSNIIWFCYFFPNLFSATVNIWAIKRGNTNSIENNLFDTKIQNLETSYRNNILSNKLAIVWLSK